MIKKILIGGLFLGGGYYLIKKILPKKTYKAEKIELDSQLSANEVFEKAKKERETKIEKKREELQKQDFTRFGSYGGYASQSILEAYKRGL